MPEKRNRQLMAIMFTDMVGYTALMQENEALAVKKRNRHREVLQSTHKQFDGEIIQYFGDGTLSLFKSAVQAVECASTIQKELQKDPQVPLRIGLNLGEVVHDEEGVYGDGINIASRIESFSVPGAVLVSAAVYNQIKNQTQFSFQSLGKFRLKNVETPQELFALTDEHLTIPKRSQLEGKGNRLTPKRYHFPKPLTSFVGRSKEISEIDSLIQEFRLVTLTGPGGMGKTRLALSVTQNLSVPFNDGIYWVPLANLTDSHSVGFAILKALGLNQDLQMTVADILVNHLKSKTLLLVLDNFEQVIGAAALIEQLLLQCAGLKTLVTSRILLKLSGEVEYPVDPLPLPSVSGISLSEQVKDNPAVNLFTHRAKAASYRFELTPKNASIVAELCHRLEGLPLAIELAAARVKIFSPQALLQRLDHRLDFLKSNRSNPISRHKTLRETIGWSYDLLDKEEKELFQRISIFTGGAAMEAIEKVCGQNGLGHFEIADGVLALVDKSLVKLEEDKEPEPRFTMLETIREFALQSLQASPKYKSLNHWHAHYFVELAEKAQPHLRGQQQDYWLSLLESEHENLKAAFYWGLSAGKNEIAFRIATALWRYWVHRGKLMEGIQMIEQLLALPEVPLLLQSRLMLIKAMGVLYINTGQYGKAIPYFEESLEGWRNIGNQDEIAICLRHLGWAYIKYNIVDKGRQYSEEALKIHQKDGNKLGQALASNNLGYACLNEGRPAAAAKHFELSFSLFQQMGDPRGIGYMQANLAFIKGLLGKNREAIDLANRALTINRKNADRIVMLWDIAVILFQFCDLEELSAHQELISELMELASSIGQSQQISNAYLFEGLLHYEKGEYDLAEEKIRKGISLTGLDDPAPIITGMYYLAINALKANDHSKVIAICRNELLKHPFGQSGLWLAQTLEVMALAYYYQQKWEAASQLFGKSAWMREQLQTPLPPRIYPSIEEMEKGLKDKLGTTTFHKMFELGKALAKEEALSLVFKN